MSWIIYAVGLAISGVSALDALIKDTKNQDVGHRPHDGEWRDGDNAGKGYVKNQKKKDKLIDSARKK